MARLALTLALVLSAAHAVPVRDPIGTLHGFPSLSDPSGRVVADGELTQEVSGDRVQVHLRWRFADGRTADERDEFRTGPALVQERFSWIETRRGVEVRRFEVDFRTGEASSRVPGEQGRDERHGGRLDLPRGRSFAGYGTALAVAQLGLPADGEAEIAFPAFTPKPRAVTLRVRRDREEPVPVAGRAIDCDRYTLHPEIPAVARPFVHAKDAHLWFTHRRPAALVRAEQSLVAKDDPVVVVDVTPRGTARRATAQARRGR